MQKWFGILAIISALTVCAEANAAPQTGLHLKNVSTQEMIKTFDKYDYKNYIYMPNWEYPSIFLDNMPKDFTSMEDESIRNKYFLMIVGPLALKVKEDILKERAEVEKLNDSFKKNKDLTSKEVKQLEEIAKKYDVFTRLKGHRRYELILNELLSRVDYVSPSILMASAAIESNWGTSNALTKANSLYKEKVWFGEEGLDPIDETEDKDYKIKIFPTLYDSMASYALKINSSINYDLYRYQRADFRYRGKPVSGKFTAINLVFDSNLENFAGLLDYTITFYELTNFDGAKLKFVTKN